MSASKMQDEASHPPRSPPAAAATAAGLLVRSETSAAAPVLLHGLSIHPELHRTVASEIAPGTGVSVDHFWRTFADVVRELAPKNAQLVAHRDELQRRIDEWHGAHAGPDFDAGAYQEFLRAIGYIVPEQGDVAVDTTNVDPEISSVPGPQLVVPADNARYALNAANARWGNLFDALYGTTAIDQSAGATKGAKYNPVRGQRVFDYSHALLDDCFPLQGGVSYADAVEYQVARSVDAGAGAQLLVVTQSGERAGLRDPTQFVGYELSAADTRAVVLRHNGLHVELQFDRSDAIGSTHPAGVKAVILEAAVSTIIDFEDSVSAVDAEDKCVVYRNFAGLMRGDLTADLGRGRTRTLRRDRVYRAAAAGAGDTYTLPGRSVLLCRNVGMHMYTDAVRTGGADGAAVPEGFLDIWCSTLGALHDLRRLNPDDRLGNSRAGSFYVVKPKMHGPSEVAATVELFARAERAFGLPEGTIKIGIMDEERRTTVNLKECIRQAARRVVFINTGFLDRTGDEIHTSMRAGPVIPKGKIAQAGWRLAYEDWNVDLGIETGLVGRGQIGKGMWAEPDDMAGLLSKKGNHPRAGATCAWVPSPTAATLHAIHYHQHSVNSAVARIAARRRRTEDQLRAILTPPLCPSSVGALDSTAVSHELDECAQLILGYVVRWVEHGVGCSKVPDLNNVGKMEDRATLRISSQLLSNWLLHGVISDAQLRAAFARWASVVDEQNARDKRYRPMAANLESSIAFQAGLRLVTDGTRLPNGYTESVLHEARRAEKAKLRRQNASPSARM